MVSVASDDLIKVWNLESTHFVQTLTAHKAYVLTMVILSIGYIASASADKKYYSNLGSSSKFVKKCLQLKLIIRLVGFCKNSLVYNN